MYTPTPTAAFDYYKRDDNSYLVVWPQTPGDHDGDVSIGFLKCAHGKWKATSKKGTEVGEYTTRSIAASALHSAFVNA